jgi:hypothetical protein
MLILDTEKFVASKQSEEAKGNLFKQRREEGQSKVAMPDKLFCECGTECDYFGVNPHKILGWVCHSCGKFCDNPSPVSEDDRWLYATNRYATISGNVKEGRVWKLSPIAARFNGLKLQDFVQQFGTRRCFVYNSKEEL